MRALLESVTLRSLPGRLRASGDGGNKFFELFYTWNLLPLIWLGITAFCILAVSIITKRPLLFPAWAWLTVYHSIIELIMLAIFIFPWLNQKFIVLLLSFALQALFLVFFIIILIVELTTWEYAFVLGLLLNYFVLLLILF